MRIAHLCLSNWYIEGVYYQENELVRQNVEDGHDVLVVASTETLGEGGKIVYTKAGRFWGPEGAEVVRLPYRLWPATLARKLRAHPDVYRLLQEFRPEAILFHGTCGWEVATVARYARNNPDVLFYIDSHEDKNNSARSFVSREFLHKLYYRFCLRRAWPTARKILCVSTEIMEFVEDTYRVPRENWNSFRLAAGQFPQESTRTVAELCARDCQLLVTRSFSFSRESKLGARS